MQKHKKGKTCKKSNKIKKCTSAPAISTSYLLFVYTVHKYSGGPNNTRGSFFDATRDPIFLGVSLFMEGIEVAPIEDLMGSQ